MFASDDFFLNEEERQFRQELSAFCQEQVEPYVDQIERTESWELLRPIVTKLGQAGYLSLPFPKFYQGGIPHPGIVHGVILSEELACRSAAVNGAAATGVIIGRTIYDFGNDEQRERYVRPMAFGEKIGAMGITEEEVGSDTAGMKTRAILDGDHWVITGKKKFIGNNSTADIFLIYCITDPTVDPHRGMSAIVVEKGARGLSTPKVFDLMGWKGLANGEVLLEEVRAPRSNLIGGLNRGFYVLMSHLNGERTLAAGQCLGIARAALEEARRFAGRRVQFGEPIGQKQDVYFKIAHLATLLDAARLLTYRAAKMIDAGIDQRSLSREASMAKYYASEVANIIANEAVQICGGEGYSKENLRAERYYRDARLLKIAGGTSEMQKYIIATQELPGLKIRL
ncbi:MAG: acyl-CoA dehydrogenase family protein [Nitrospinae bacterium]|nr:acyl-CoA dehydrogenase family protein [Nitrospinota bacterium]